jgi:hypothetical protein
MQVCYQLSNAKKADMIVATYFHKMKGHADTISSLCHPLTDEEVHDYMLAGLGASMNLLWRPSLRVMIRSAWRFFSFIYSVLKFIFIATTWLMRSSNRLTLPLASLLRTSVVALAVAVAALAVVEVVMVVVAVVQSRPIKYGPSMVTMLHIVANTSTTPSSQKIIMGALEMLLPAPPTLLAQLVLERWC